MEIDALEIVTQGAGGHGGKQGRVRNQNKTISHFSRRDCDWGWDMGIGMACSGICTPGHFD